jgi:Tol biopolymer transport system component
VHRLIAVGLLVILLAACSGDSSGGSRSTLPEDLGIVFSSSRDGDFEIYLLDEGGTVRPLTQNESDGENEADDTQPSWSPDGSRIVFASTRDHEGDGFGSSEIYVMEADGSQQSRLTNNSVGEARPQWTPDGKRIAFLRLAQGEPTRFELAIMEGDGDNPKTLVDQGNIVGGFDWSPDGSRIAFTSCEGDIWTVIDCDIWVANADGSGRRQLTDAPGSSSSPAWSPRGTKIAFVSDRDENGDCFFHDCVGHNGEIYVMDADGSDQTRLTDDPGADESPTWSPDSRRIAFAGLRNVTGAVDAPHENYEIYVMEADGASLRRLTQEEAWDWHPDWS